MSMLLGTTGRIWRRTTEVTAGGGTALTWTPGVTLPCRIAPIEGDERVTGLQINDRSTHVVTLPAYTVIEETDQIVIEDAMYDVVAVRKRTFDELVRRAEVVESADALHVEASGAS